MKWTGITLRTLQVLTGLATDARIGERCGDAPFERSDRRNNSFY
jgi:hypothetical protein